MAAVRIPFNRACTWGSMTEFENRTSENVDARNLNAEHARRTLLDLDLELKYTRRENVSRNVEPGAKYWHQVAQEHAKNLKSTYELAKADYHRRNCLKGAPQSLTVSGRHWVGDDPDQELVDDPDQELVDDPDQEL
eukprot:Selendium_serpulae@DN3752_c0_g1_i1.p1